MKHRLFLYVVKKVCWPAENQEAYYRPGTQELAPLIDESISPLPNKARRGVVMINAF